MLKYYHVYLCIFVFDLSVKEKGTIATLFQLPVAC